MVLMVGAEQLVIRNTFEHLLMIRRRTGDKFFFIVNKKKIILSSSLRLAMRSAFTRLGMSSNPCTTVRALKIAFRKGSLLLLLCKGLKPL